MQLHPYLNFNGDCEAAFRFYAECFDGTLGEIFRYAGSPMADQVPADLHDKVMHASITAAGQVLMGGDVPSDKYEKPKGFSLSVQMNDVELAERIFQQFSNGGAIVMPFEKTFWAARFGMLVDRFGIPWMINCDAPTAQ